MIPADSLASVLAEAKWYAEARDLIREQGHEVEYDSDLLQHRIDGVLVSGGQIAEMAFVLGKEPLKA